MSKPYVSVLIDTYNHERFIEQAIASVLAQDRPLDDVEIIVVDDGSTDRTPEIVHGFEPRVRLIRKTNGGQASAFNVGVPECRGEIVAFLDGDDWWAPQKLRRVVEALELDREVGIIGNGITEVLENGDEHSEILQDNRRFRIDSLQGARIFRRRKSQLGTSRMTVRVEILRKILPVPEALIIEADEYIFTLAAGLSVASILGEALTYYRIHGDNLFQISGFKKDSVRRKQKSLEALIAGLSEKLHPLGLSRDVIEAVLAEPRAEATQLRLQTDGGFPWETVGAEWKSYGVSHENGPLGHRCFKIISLLPALFLPPRLYYRVRRELAVNRRYLQLRKLIFPIPEPQHVMRSRKSTS